MEEPDRTRYSLDWARGVVERLSEKHARATEIVSHFCRVDSETLAWYLANGDRRFVVLRNLIKSVSLSIDVHGRALTGAQMEAYLSHAGVLSQANNPEMALDIRRFRSIMEKSG